MLQKGDSHGGRIAVSRRVLNGSPARTLGDAVKLCDPSAPLDPIEDRALIADLSAQRGGDRLATVGRTIRRSGATPTLQFLTGHVGSGKTTELLRLKEALTQRTGDLPAHEVLLLDADTMLDRNDVDLEDLLVALWVLVADTGRSAAREILEEVWKEQIASVLKKAVIDLPSAVFEALNKLQDLVRLQAPDQRVHLRRSMAPVLSALIKGLNRALLKVPEEGEQTVVILIDNLEKLSQGQQLTTERLYLERMGALKQLEAHLVITVPLDLVFSPVGASLTARYGADLVVLPMIKVRDKRVDGGGVYKSGRDALVALLARRVDFGELFEEGRVAAEEIARLSGGCIRHALRIVQSAINEHDEPPVTRASIDRAAATLKADFERALPEAWIPLLKVIDEINDFPPECPPEVKREMLRHLYVLEYQNGDPGPWWAVHPLVAESRKFRDYAP